MIYDQFFTFYESIDFIISKKKNNFWGVAQNREPRSAGFREKNVWVVFSDKLKTSFASVYEIVFKFFVHSNLKIKSVQKDF
jgi:hypothetical protein